MPIPVLVGEPPVKNSITFRGLELNDHADDEKDTYAIEDVTENDAYQQVIEPLPDRDGSQTYEPFNMNKVFRIRGWVRGSTLAKLYDAIEELNAKFDPVLTYIADSGNSYNRGYMPIKFNVPTNDVGNYPTGLIACQYYVQALRRPVASMSKFGGYNARIDFMLRAADPRRYLQTDESETLGGNGSITLDNTLADYPSYPIFTIEMSTTAPTGELSIGRGSPSFSGEILIDGDALAANTTYILDTRARTFKTSGGTNKIAAIKGTSEFFDIQGGMENTISRDGFPTDSQVTVTWTRAFV